MGPADFTLDFYAYFSENILCRQVKFRIFELKQYKIFLNGSFKKFFFSDTKNNYNLKNKKQYE